MNHSFRFTAMAFTAFLAGTTGIAVHAQAYPTKPITAIVYGAAGTTPDLFARAVTRLMGASMGQPFVVENRPGASGVIATKEVIRSAPDGYTVLFTSNTSLVNVTKLMKKAPYDPVAELTPIGATYTPVEVLIVRSDLPATTVPDLIAYAKQNPGKLNYGAAGKGSIFHLNGEAFSTATGIKMQNVAYKGPLAALQDVAAGNVDMAFNSFGGLAGMLATGRVRVLAVLDKERYKGLPNVATIAESVPSYQKVDSWAAMMAPAKLPPALASKLNAELNKALKSPEMTKWMEDNVAQPIGGSPTQVGDLMSTTSVRLQKLMDQIGLKPE